MQIFELISILICFGLLLWEILSLKKSAKRTYQSLNERINYRQFEIERLQKEIARVLNIVNTNQAGKMEDMNWTIKKIYNIQNKLFHLEDDFDGHIIASFKGTATTKKPKKLKRKKKSKFNFKFR